MSEIAVHLVCHDVGNWGIFELVNLGIVSIVNRIMLNIYQNYLLYIYDVTSQFLLLLSYSAPRTNQSMQSFLNPNTVLWKFSLDIVSEVILCVNVSFGALLVGCEFGLPLCVFCGVSVCVLCACWRRRRTGHACVQWLTFGISVGIGSSQQLVLPDWGYGFAFLGRGGLLISQYLTWKHGWKVSTQVLVICPAYRYSDPISREITLFIYRVVWQLILRVSAGGIIGQVLLQPVPGT